MEDARKTCDDRAGLRQIASRGEAHTIRVATWTHRDAPPETSEPAPPCAGEGKAGAFEALEAKE